MTDQTHRITWFHTDRPVEGTVYIKPEGTRPMPVTRAQTDAYATILGQLGDDIRSLHRPWTVTGEPYARSGVATWQTCSTCGGNTYPCTTVAVLEEVDECGPEVDE